MKGASKDAKIYAERSKTGHNLLAQNGVNNYCVLCTVKAKKIEQKPKTKKFVGFHNHFPLLTMVCFDSFVIVFADGNYFPRYTLKKDIWLFQNRIPGSFYHLTLTPF